MYRFLTFLFLNKKGQQSYAIPLVTVAALVVFGWIIGQHYHLFFKWNYHDVIGYDKLLHTLGGAWWALFGVALYDFNRGGFDRLLLGFDPEKNKKRTWAIMLTALAWSLTIGISWEALEYAWPWLRGFFPWNPFDTFMDVVYDTIGALSIGRLYSKWILIPLRLPSIEIPIDIEVAK